MVGSSEHTRPSRLVALRGRRRGDFGRRVGKPERVPASPSGRGGETGRVATLEGHGTPGGQRPRTEPKGDAWGGAFRRGKALKADRTDAVSRAVNVRRAGDASRGARTPAAGEALKGKEPHGRTGMKQAREVRGGEVKASGGCETLGTPEGRRWQPACSRRGPGTAEGDGTRGEAAVEGVPRRRWRRTGLWRRSNPVGGRGSRRQRRGPQGATGKTSRSGEGTRRSVPSPGGAADGSGDEPGRNPRTRRGRPSR